MRVHAEVRGSGPPIVFTHGIGSSSKTWNGLVERLSDRYTTVVWDLLGHEKSPVPDEPSAYTRDRVLDDLTDVIAFADDTCGPSAPKPVLVGHSLGGYLTLAHGATRPGASRALVVFATGPGFRDPEKREAWNERSRRNAHRFGVPTQAAEMNLQEDSVVMESLAEMSVPTLVMSGSEDRPEYAGSGQYLERKMPDARFLGIDGGDHFMHEEAHAQLIADHISTFITDSATS